MDWDRVARWTNDVVSSNLSEIEACFTGNGVASPTVAWAPDPSVLPAKPLRVLLGYWSGLRDGDAIPSHARVDPTRFVSALGYVNILERLPGSLDLRYRLFGTTVAWISGFDMTGKLLSDHPSSEYVRIFALATSRAPMIRREPLFTMREPAGAEKVYRWPRLVLPLAGGDGAVDRVIVATVPLDGRGEIVA